tara:strand:+ start:125 stop:1246 length:1122 start_codon:yes stop_codon:yes gene_type:complete
MDHYVTEFFIALIVVIIGSIIMIFWDTIKEFCFKKDQSDQSGVKAGRDINIDHGVVATDDAKVHVDNKTVLQQNFIIQEPVIARKPISKSDKDEKVDKKVRDEVEKIMKRQPTPENKSLLRERFYSTEDGVLKIQIALMLGPWFDPMEDVTSELIEITNEAIPLARLAKAKPHLAALYAYKGAYYTFLFTHEHREFDFKLFAHKGQLEGLTEFYERELLFKEEYSEECFHKAEKIAEESGDYEAIAAVYLEMGQAAAHRATVYATELDKRGKAKELVREAFSKAGQAYVDVASDLPNSGELEIANVKHNLANSLRMLGAAETEEAIQIEEAVFKVANKFGDAVLKRKAEVLLKHMKTGEMPNYVKGEKGEDLF